MGLVQKLQCKAGYIALYQKNIWAESLDSAHEVAKILSLLSDHRLETHEVLLVSSIDDREGDKQDPRPRYVSWHTLESDVLGKYDSRYIGCVGG